MPTAHTSIESPVFENQRRVSHIVLPASATHLHERHAPYAASLAKRWGVPLRLIHVTGSLTGSSPELDAVVDNLRHSRPGLEVEAETVFGDDVAKTLADAIDPQAFVVMVSEHADPWRIKGSVANDLSSRLGAPLLLLGPNVSIETLTGEIVVAMDGSLAAQAALDRAIALSHAFEGHPRVWMVRVLPVPTGEQTDSHSRIVLALQAQAESITGTEVRWEVIQSNDPIDAITSFASRRKASFIVTGLRSRNDMRRRTMGSVAMGLVQRAEQPVMPVPSQPLQERDDAMRHTHREEEGDVATA